jgi:hypothetical protein
MDRVRRRHLLGRRLGALIIGGLLAILSVLPAGGQDEPEPAGNTTPRSGPKWVRATLPSAKRGWEVHDVISGGPGFIAVGGGFVEGSPQRPGALPQVLIWVSDDGRRWQSVPLFGDAAHGIVEAITATPTGFVAVGRECCPDRAVVWRSAEGITWERLPDSDDFEGAAMFDVVAGPSGLVAVGCQATLECAMGRTWRSEDGSTWEAPSELPLIPSAVGVIGDILVAAGSTGGFEGRSVLATSPDGADWMVAEAGGRPGVLFALGRYPDGILAAGSGGALEERVRAVLLTSADGVMWQSIGSPRFRDSGIAALAVSDGLVLLAGWRLEGDRTVPFSLWSADLEAFQRGRFPKPSEREGGRVNGAAFSPDGSLAVAVGTLESARPAIWFSEMELP